MIQKCSDSNFHQRLGLQPSLHVFICGHGALPLFQLRKVSQGFLYGDKDHRHGASLKLKASEATPDLVSVILVYVSFFE